LNVQSGHVNIAFEDEEEKKPVEAEIVKAASPRLSIKLKSIAGSVKSKIESSQDMNDEDKQRKVLKAALKDAPYNYLNKPNKNLVHDDMQDMNSQLERRLLASQWISRRLSNYNQNEEDCNSSVSSNSAWKRNVINSKTLRKPSIGSIAMSIAGTSSGNRIRTISGSSIKENYQNKT